MKKLLLIVLCIVCQLGVVSLCFFCIGCNGNTNQPQGVVYQPETKNSSLSDEQRQAAIARQRAALNGYLDSVSYRNAVKLTIMVPKVTEEFTMQAAEVLASRMLQITAANGIAGYGGDPSFVLATLITPMQKGITSGVPAKKYTNYSINFYVANLVTGDVFGTVSREVMGVGDSEELACLNAVQSIQNDDEIKDMLRQSSEKIVNWFESNKATVIAKVNQYVQLGEYGKAYALLVSVPEAASSCFDFAQTHVDGVYALYRERLSTTYYYAMLDAMSDSEQYNPVAGAYMRQIPSNAPIYATAAEAFQNYVSHCKDVEDARRAHEMYVEQENLAIERINAEANLKANEALLVQSQAEAERQSQSQTESGLLNPIGGFKERVTDLITDKAVSIVTFGVDRLLGCLGLFL